MIIQRMLLVALSAMVMLNSAVAEPASEKVLYREPLSGDRELVVIQGPMVPTSELAGLLSADVADRTLGYFNIDVELRPKSMPPLRLLSHRYSVNYDSEYEEYSVLDLLILPNRLVMVMGRSLSSIAILEVVLDGSPSRVSGLQGADWSLLAAAIPTPPGRLSAKLTYNENKERIEVQVTDFLQDTKQHTQFVQKGNEWEFEPVKQWQEKVPEAK